MILTADGPSEPMVTRAAGPRGSAPRVRSDETASTRRREEEARPLEGATDVTGVAFHALLRVAQGVVVGGRGTEEASASQLFEPPARRDGAESGQARETPDRSAPPTLPTEDRYDRTSVTARRAINSGPESGTRASAPTPTGSAADGPARGGSSGSLENVVEDRAAASSSIERIPLSSTQTTGTKTRSSAGEPVGRATGLAGALPSSSTAQASVVKGHESVSAMSAPGAAGASKAQTPAQRLAQILGSARGGAESSRAPTSAPAASGANDSSTARNPTPHPSQSGVPREQESSHAAEGSRNSAKGVERSPFDELVRSFRLKGGSLQSTARMQLHPPELGRLRVDVRVVGDGVRIDVRTETDAARKLLRTRAGELAHALEQQGVSVDRFDVAVALDVDDFSDSTGRDRADPSSRRAEGNRTGDVDERSDRPAERDRPVAPVAAAGTARRPRIDVRV